MIVANLATYPPRRAFLRHVLSSISPQVDRVNVVLNEYESVPDEAAGFSNVHPIIPTEDTKDTGKFLPDVSGAEYVFFIDDDLLYPEEYVTRSLSRLQDLPFGSVLAGYHCSIYEAPRLSPSIAGMRRLVRYWLRPDTIAGFRRIYGPGNPVSKPIFVDQVATNAAVMRAQDVPPFDYMRSSQKFVDVRLARWCFERGIPRVCIALDKGWLTSSSTLGFRFDETIVDGFTFRHHPHVAQEIRSFAFRTPGVGKAA